MEILTNLISRVLADYEAQIGEAETQVSRLIDQRAGLAHDPTGQDGRCRLRQPRLITTAPKQRRLALEKKMLEYRDVIAAALPEVVAAAMKLTTAESEIATIHKREGEARADWELFHKEGIFMSAALALTRLYERHKITRWHWSNVSDEQLAAIAKILHPDAKSGDVP